MTDSELTD